MTWPRIVVGVVACVYAAGVFNAVLLPFPIGTGNDSTHVPWQAFINLTPLIGTEPSDMVQNVVLFVPLGVLLPLMARVSSARRVLLDGFLLSLGIEVVQLVSDVAVNAGHAADINDLLANALGALVGYGIFRLVLVVPTAARVAEAATWPALHDEQAVASAARSGDHSR